jgi:hypothetical protein
VLLIPLQVLLIFFTMFGFRQGWNVEKEVPKDESKRKEQGGGSKSSSGEPATA